MNRKVDEKQMKIGLISANEGKHGLYPMGIMYMASYVRKYVPDIEFVLYDMIPEVDEVIQQGFDVIGVSSMTVHFYNANKFGRELRQRYDGYIMLGGIHFSLEKILPDWADLGVVGEGEITLLELVQLFMEKGSYDCEGLKGIKGVAYRENGKLIFNEPRPLMKNLDDIPFPARDLVDMEYYLKPNNTFGTKVGRGLSIMTSRGCPFHCDFCSTSEMWVNTRFHSAEYVVDEIEMLVKEYGVEYLYVVDDNFCSNKQRLKDIGRLMTERGIKVEIGASGRIEYYDDEIRDIYRQIGIKALSFGFETGSDRMLKLVKGSPKLNVQQSIEMAKRIINDGIEVQGMFMLNMPEETLEDLELTVKMIKEIPMAKLGITIATPFYATKWWNVAVEQGIVPRHPDPEFWKTYDLKLLEQNRPLFKTSIDTDKLYEIYDDLIEYQKKLFYFDWQHRE